MAFLLLFLIMIALIPIKTPTSMTNAVKYAVMIDAGSSGSRVQIYVWSSHKIRFLKDRVTGEDVFMKITPGLSSTSRDPDFASEYIDPLLDFAAKHIPQEEHSSTLLYILATAGMRMLEKEVQESILDDLRHDIPKKYNFNCDPSNFAVITGKEEGIYSWIALNDMTHKFKVKEISPVNAVTIDLDESKTVTRERTIGMLEMGGASTQIAFEVTTKRDLDLLRQEDDLKDVLVKVNLASEDEDKTYLLYVKTFLGLGANEARDRHWKLLFKKTNGRHELFDPCMNPSLRETFAMKPNQFVNDSILLQIQGTGNYEECSLLLKELLAVKESSECPVTDLSRTQVSFEGTEFYAFSEFFYSTDDVYHLGGKYYYDKVTEANKRHCSLDWNSMSSHYSLESHPRADDERLRTQCFKGSFLQEFLHQGLKMPKTYSNLTTVDQIEGNTAQFTLGALIFLQSSASRNSLIMMPHQYLSEHLTTQFFICILVLVALTVIYLRIHCSFPVKRKERSLLQA